ncbi:hypothetical protein Asppvi_005476 [Aspergillus pseudoviridinutans]|uniref:Uncharacterized protein n=1 Tax=Aspergillus pseudoviridinutans TaxID=1517512 RepID=A0A9P3BF55_9EURO|nr:uncharacterized protein Asppvi_005476 [Aspergillus pseudoviridinutans]GIJ86586.1 hypothetical protein Asppvi_005476 [Aspergillus pseudoviridinutans]
MPSNPPPSVNPNEVPNLPMDYSFDTLYNTVPPHAFLQDLSTIGGTGHLFTGATQPPLPGYEPFQQTCFSDWTLQDVSHAAVPPILASQNFFPDLRLEFMEDLLPLAAEAYPEHLLEQQPDHRCYNRPKIYDLGEDS